VLISASSYNNSPSPRTYQLVAALVVSLKAMAMTHSLKIIAMLEKKYPALKICR